MYPHKKAFILYLKKQGYPNEKIQIIDRVVELLNKKDLLFQHPAIVKIEAKKLKNRYTQLYLTAYDLYHEFSKKINSTPPHLKNIKITMPLKKAIKLAKQYPHINDQIEFFTAHALRQGKWEVR